MMHREHVCQTALLHRLVLPQREGNCNLDYVLDNDLCAATCGRCTPAGGCAAQQHGALAACQQATLIPRRAFRCMHGAESDCHLRRPTHCEGALAAQIACCSVAAPPITVNCVNGSSCNIAQNNLQAGNNSTLQGAANAARFGGRRNAQLR